jgi:hypothetical protein
VDCADRIAVLAAERTLAPVRALAQTGAPAAATVPARLARRRLEVTIRRWSVGGPERPPAYGWEVREVGVDGAATPGGLELPSRPSATAGDPEDAYWTALEAAQASVDSAPA